MSKLSDYEALDLIEIIKTEISKIDNRTKSISVHACIDSIYEHLEPLEEFFKDRKMEREAELAERDS